MNNGATVNILTISSVETDVVVYGRVKFPNSYPGANMNLKDILTLAGGFDDPLYRETIRDDEIIILRRDSKNFYNQTFIKDYNTSETFDLEPGDKIFVYENINYQNSFTYRVDGEVNKPGTYPLKSSSITVKEALFLAEGLTELSSIKNIILTQEYTEVDINGLESTSQIEVSNVSLDFELGSNSVLTALPFENVVKIQGNVYNPGLVIYQDGLRLSDYIKLAGGYKPDTLKKKVYIKQANGRLKATSRIYLVSKKINAGDTIIVPLNESPADFDIGSFTTDMLSILTNLVAILAIVDNTSD